MRADDRAQRAPSLHMQLGAIAAGRYPFHGLSSEVHYLHIVRKELHKDR